MTQFNLQDLSLSPLLVGLKEDEVETLVAAGEVVNTRREK